MAYSSALFETATKAPPTFAHLTRSRRPRNTPYFDMVLNFLRRPTTRYNIRFQHGLLFFYLDDARTRPPHALVWRLLLDRQIARSVSPQPRSLAQYIYPTPSELFPRHIGW
ncbi:hypothetical protein PMIN06_004516 [Paraphaeosphaeria minitans]